jgi:hypothetical protein
VVAVNLPLVLAVLVVAVLEHQPALHQAPPILAAVVEASSSQAQALAAQAWSSSE